MFWIRILQYYRNRYVYVVFIFISFFISLGKGTHKNVIFFCNYKTIVFICLSVESPIEIVHSSSFISYLHYSNLTSHHWISPSTAFMGTSFMYINHHCFVHVNYGSQEWNKISLQMLLHMRDWGEWFFALRFNTFEDRQSLNEENCNRSYFNIGAVLAISTSLVLILSNWRSQRSTSNRFQWLFTKKSY